MLIYVLRDPFTKEIRYVGKTTRTLQIRLRQHVATARLGKPAYVYRWIRKLSTDPLIEPLLIASSYEELNALEKACIAFGRSVGLRLTNMSEGGDGSAGFKRPAATRRKMRKVQNAPGVAERKREYMYKLHADPTWRAFRYRDEIKKRYYCSDGRIFVGMNEAMRQLGVSHGVFYRLLRGRLPTRFQRRTGLKLATVPFP